MAGLTSVQLVLLLGQSRMFFAMSRDGLLPPAFCRVHPRFRTPYIPTIMTGIAVGLTAAFLPIEEIAELTNIGTLFAFFPGVYRSLDSAPHRPRPQASLQDPTGAAGADSRRDVLRLPDGGLPG